MSPFQEAAHLNHEGVTDRAILEGDQASAISSVFFVTYC
jgi:hypothetical protein